MQVPSSLSNNKQLEDSRLLQSESSKHCPVVAVNDQSGYKDFTVVKYVFRAVTPCSPVLSAVSVFRMYEGWNFNFGNTPLDWMQELLE